MAKRPDGNIFAELRTGLDDGTLVNFDWQNRLLEIKSGGNRPGADQGADAGSTTSMALSSASQTTLSSTLATPLYHHMLRR
jgi:hypothetical protein